MPKFGKPDAPRGGRGRQKLPPLPYVAPADDGAYELLQDFRHVYLNDPSHDKTHGQRMARRFIDADICKFSAALNRMEMKFRKQLEKEQGIGGQMKRDIRAERAVEFINRLLDKLEAEEDALPDNFEREEETRKTPKWPGWSKRAKCGSPKYRWRRRTK